MAIAPLSKKELAEIAGYTYRWLYNIDRDLPDDKKLFVPVEKGKQKYDVPKFVQRWVAYNTENSIPEDTDLAAAKTKHEIIKTQKTELEVARMRGQMIDVQDVKKLWGDIANAVVQNLLGLPKKLGPALVMIESAEVISAMIDDEVRQILNDIADTPLPEYVQDDDTESESDDE